MEGSSEETGSFEWKFEAREGCHRIEDDLDVDHSECMDKNAKDLENVQKALETIGTW